MLVWFEIPQDTTYDQTKTVVKFKTQPAFITVGGEKTIKY